MSKDKLKPRQLYFLVEEDSFYYCVPAGDVQSVDPEAVSSGQEIPFKFNTLNLKGTVTFISSKY